MVFKDRVFKREKWISELPSGRFPIEVTPESGVFVTLHHSASGVPFSGPCLWTWTQRCGDGLPEPWGIYLSVPGTMSPNHQLPASFSPAPLPPPPQAQRTLIPLVVLSVRSATCCPQQGLCATPSWTSHAAGMPTTLRSLLFLETHPAALSPGEGVKETLAPHEHLLKLMDLMPGICQAVIQARGDLDGDKASIVKKKTLWSSLWSLPWTPRYSEGRKPCFLQKPLRVNGRMHSIRNEWIFSLDLCLKHEEWGENIPAVYCIVWTYTCI